MPQFPVTGPVRLDVSTIAGELRVTAVDTEEVVVRVDPTNPHDDYSRRVAEDTRVEVQGDQVVVEVPKQLGLIHHAPALDISVTVPTDSRLNLRSASAEVACTGGYAEATVSTASGDVSLGRVTGRATVKTASGDVTIESVGGELSVSTASGDIDVREAAAATLTTASGDIQAGRCTGDVRARTASGDVTLREVAAVSVGVQTVSGDVSLGLLPGVAAWLDVSSLTGDVVSSLGVDGNRPEGEAATATVRGNSVSGDVRVYRAAGAPA